MLQIKDSDGPGDELEKKAEELLISHIENYPARDYHLWRYLSFLPECDEVDYVVHTDFDQFIKNVAKEVQVETIPGSYTSLLCLLYQGKDSLTLTEIQQPVYNGTKIQTKYYEKIQEIHNEYGKPSSHYSISAGAWIPQGNNKLLGNHPEIGGSVGLTGALIQADIALAFRFLDSKQSYVMRDDLGSLQSTSKFQGWYLGADVSRELITVRNFSFDIVAGLGYDGFLGISGNEDESKHVNSFNLNLGCKPKIFLDRYHTEYIGIQVRYNFVWYYTHGGTDLSGNTLSISLCYGRYPKSGYEDRLRQFHYID
ncbi:MAG: hypothetical protein JSV49_06170 [Thermoplasmata archaeon]|nr:MAG: hypothetical protein JSV49_06170 [Thermoplasmata archaeon]